MVAAKRRSPEALRSCFNASKAISKHKEQLEVVLTAAARAVGNQQRFLTAGLIDSTSQLTADWLEAFTRLRPLDKTTLRQNPGNFLADADDVVYRGKTSGSSGESFTYFAGQRWNRQRLKGRSQQMSWWGLSPDIPMLNLASRLSPVREQDVSLIGAIDADFLEKLQIAVRQGPVILRGYPSRLCEVAVAVRHTHTLWDFDNAIAVISTGECLFEYQRSLLEETFGSPVINEYGCPEAGISGMTCPEEERLHLDSDRCLYEIVDGRLLVTDLYNTTMPMVRYCNGDRLRIESTPCPCGRPGLIAQVLGREEEHIRVDSIRVDSMRVDDREDYRWPGEMRLPSFPDILSYQLRISPQKQQLWIQPETNHRPPDLAPVEDWLSSVFNSTHNLDTEKKETTVVLESSLDIHVGEQTCERTLTAVDSETWVQQVQKSSWTNWLSQPLPIGEAEAIARLLRQLVAPRYVVTKGLPIYVQEKVQSLLESDRARLSQLEALKIRTLLWAVSLLPDADKERIYLTLFERSREWVDMADEGDRQACSALAIDLLAPLLVLETSTAQKLWPEVQTFIQRIWTDDIRADRFTLHHYLAVLSVAGRKAQQLAHPWTPALRPLSAILIGDFQMLARLGPRAINLAQIATWADIVRGLPDTFTKASKTLSVSSNITPSTFFDERDLFYATWRTGRQHLLRTDYSRFEQTLAQLFDIAQTSQQMAQCWLERGYGTLLSGETLALDPWVDILKTQIEVSSTSANPHGHKSYSQQTAQTTDPLPWLPILRQMASQLIAAGQPRMAYACLFAAAPPSRTASLFDRYCPSVNNKQSVISYRHREQHGEVQR